MVAAWRSSDWRLYQGGTHESGSLISVLARMIPHPAALLAERHDMAGHAYIVGHPVGHSKSPVMHNAAFQALGFSGDYGFADCATEDKARAFLLTSDWLYCNVTMPYKPLALQIADDASAAAHIAGGANVLVCMPDGRIWADNTDGAGCIAFMQRAGACFKDAWVAVCGTGPTALSIMHACACAQADGIALFSRDALRAAHALEGYADALNAAVAACGLANGPIIERYEDPWSFVAGNPASAEYVVGRDALAAVGGIPAPDPNSSWSAGRPLRFSALAYDDSPSSIKASTIIIDATSLGMHQDDPAPFDTQLLHAGQTVFDVVYGHGETALIRAARAKGCCVLDGSGMLVAQAVETLRDVAHMAGSFTIPADLDLFALMLEAGFPER